MIESAAESSVPRDSSAGESRFASLRGWVPRVIELATYRNPKRALQPTPAGYVIHPETKYELHVSPATSLHVELAGHADGRMKVDVNRPVWAKHKQHHAAVAFTIKVGWTNWLWPQTRPMLARLIFHAAGGDRQEFELPLLVRPFSSPQGLIGALLLSAVLTVPLEILVGLVTRLAQGRNLADAFAVLADRSIFGVFVFAFVVTFATFAWRDFAAYRRSYGNVHRPANS